MRIESITSLPINEQRAYEQQRIITFIVCNIPPINTARIPGENQIAFIGDRGLLFEINGTRTLHHKPHAE